MEDMIGVLATAGFLTVIWMMGVAVKNHINKIQRSPGVVHSGERKYRMK